MTNEITQIASLATQELIKESVPVTHDRGDALNAAHQILGASASYCFGKPHLVPLDVYRIVSHAQQRIGKQYAEWLRGGEV